MGVSVYRSLASAPASYVASESAARRSTTHNIRHAAIWVEIPLMQFLLMSGRCLWIIGRAPWQGWPEYINEIDFRARNLELAICYFTPQNSTPKIQEANNQTITSHHTFKYLTFSRANPISQYVAQHSW